MSKTIATLTFKSSTEYALKVRKKWDFNPAPKAFKSIRDYNRKDKSWKKDID